MLDNQRHLFDMPVSIHYLNCAFMTPLLKSLVEIGVVAVHQKSRPWELDPADFFLDTQGLTQALAKSLKRTGSGL